LQLSNLNREEVLHKKILPSFESQTSLFHFKIERE